MSSTYSNKFTGNPAFSAAKFDELADQILQDAGEPIEIELPVTPVPHWLFEKFQKWKEAWPRKPENGRYQETEIDQFLSDVKNGKI